MSELTFKIVKNMGIIGEAKEGWKKEVNLVSWNERKPKLDIREWDEKHERMKKGVTLNTNEVMNLKSILLTFDNECMNMEM